MNEISKFCPGLVEQASTEERLVAYWDEFYRASATRSPSQFAALVASELKSAHVIIDIGCGNGRDSFFFNNMGHVVLGLDASKTAILTNCQNVRDTGAKHIEFLEHTVGKDSLKSAFDAVEKLQATTLPCVLYSRFFLHAIPEEAEDHLIGQISSYSGSIKSLFLEYRELRDAEIEKTFGNHYRRFIDAGALCQKLVQRSDFSLDYQAVSRGFAKYGKEDPWIARQIFHGNR